MFSLLSPWPLLAAVALAFATACLLLRWHRPETEGAADAGRFGGIDGLRGYLAFAVFIHHAVVWRPVNLREPWALPDSHLYAHLGQSSVAMFFMITGFLFFGKLLDGRHRPIDWTRLIASRIARLLPLYLVALAALLLLVGHASQWQLRETPAALAGQLLQWLLFTVGGAPDVNGVVKTRYILAGVTWSLAYEWYFYLSLPLLAALVGVRAPPVFTALGLLFGLGSLVWAGDMTHFSAFVGGMVAALAVRHPRLRRIARHGVSSIAILVLLGLTVTQYAGAYQRGPLVMLSVAFTLIAGGNTLFGLLAHPASKLLGEMAYSLYLLHGLLLHITFRLLLGPSASAALTESGHWALVLALVPVLVAVCFVSHRFIELPGMRWTAPLTRWLKAPLRGLRSAPPAAGRSLPPA